MIRANGVRAYLAGDVYLYGAVDRRHFRIRADYGRVVHVVDVQGNNGWVIVDKIIELSASQEKRRHGLSAMFPFVLIGDNAVLNKRDNSVREHFGMDTQLFMVFQTF